LKRPVTLMVVGRFLSSPMLARENVGEQLARMLA
jgi:hypothetical protein